MLREVVTRLKDGLYGASSDRVVAAIALTVTANILIMVINVCSGSLGARLLGVQGRGEWAAIQLWPMLIASLGGLGMTEALVFFSSRKPRDGMTFAITSWTLLLPLSLFWIPIGYLAMPVLLSRQGEQVIQASRLLLLVIPFEFVAISYHVLRGWQDFARWNIVRIYKPLMYLLILLSLWLAGQADPFRLSQLYLILSVSLVPLVLVVLLHHSRKHGRARIGMRHAKPMLNYGLRSAIGGLPMTLNARLDQMLMAMFLAPAQLGLYVVAVSWSTLLGPMMSAIGYVVFPNIASAAKLEDAKDRFARTVRVSLALSAVSTAAVLLVTPLAMRLLFGESFLPAIPSALVLVAAGFFSYSNLVIQHGLRGLGLPEATAWAEGFGLFATVGLLALLLPRLQILGAAFASLIAYGWTFLVLVWFSAKRGQVTPRHFMVPQRDDWHALRALVARLGQGA